MKKLCLILTFIMLFACGCSNSPVILLNKNPITRESILYNSREFKPGEKIYYIFLHKKKLKSDYITVEIMKKETKVEFWGFKKVFSDEYKLRNDQIYYYEDYVVLYEKGLYYMQVRSRYRPDKVIAQTSFWIND